MRALLFALVLSVTVGLLPVSAKERPTFEANWESLNARKSPAWFEDAKFGIFIHWGVYSVPAYCHKSTYSEWYWRWLWSKSHGGFVSDFHEKWYGKDFTYQDFAPQFRAELWDPEQWADLFKRAGAKYVVLVSKHHDGYALWPSEEASASRGYAWNSMEIGPKRDICGELTDAVKGKGLRMGLYYSLMEWRNPVWSNRAAYVEDHMIPQIKDLVTRYKPAIIWPDGAWVLRDTAWRSPEIIAWLYNNVENYEEIAVNDRWGRDIRGQVGDFYTTEYGHLGGNSPGLKTDKPFEECRGIGKSFALNRLENIDDYQSRTSLVHMLIDLVSKGGNLLLNIGPDADGTIPVIMQDRLMAIGNWLDVNGEAIYGTRKGLFTKLPWGRSTTKGNTIYLHVFKWPDDHTLELNGLVTGIKNAYLLHDKKRTPLKITTKDSGGSLQINLLGHHPFEHASVIALELDGVPDVDLTNAILPDEHGVVTLPAESAELKGGLKVEKTVVQSGNETVGLARKQTLHNIGHWLKENASASWEARVVPNATYRISLLHANAPGTEGSRFRLSIGDKQVEQTIEANTGGWQTYKEISVGTVTVGSEKDVTITMQSVNIHELALTNVRWIKLVPVREGE